MKRLTLFNLFSIISFLTYAQTINHTGDYFISNGKLRVEYPAGGTTVAQFDNSSGVFGTQGIGTLNGGDVHVRGFWGVVIDKNAGGLGEDIYYANGVNPAGGSFAVRTRTSSTAFRTDFIIRNNGNIGIGTINPDVKLAVKGTVHAQEVKVDLSVPAPDYVFDKDYSLRSLESVKEYIDEHHHLPEVPSAKELEQNGLNTGEMNLLLLKKVEELTLYVIELKKELDSVKKGLK